jgi:hypothetical protein
MPRNKHLYIHPSREADGTISCKLTDHRNPGLGGDATKINLSRNSGRHDFHFAIVNRDDTEVEFKNDPVDIGEDCACPPPAGIGSEQIFDVHRLNSTQMSFVDRNNGKERTLIYQLNMHENGKDCSLDPEIRNGGGTGNFVSFAIGAIGGGVAGALIASLTGADAAANASLTYGLVGAVVGGILGYLVGR